MLSLDIRRLQRRGVLIAGVSSSWLWSRDGEPAGSIGITCGPDRLRLAYVRARDGNEPEHFSYDILLTQTRCHFGGVRRWFECPWCACRCALVYGVSRDGRFACRRCMRLGYSSEAEGRCDRLWRKLRKLEARLLDGDSRPKGMHQRTFEGICELMDIVEEALDEELFISAAIMLGIDRRAAWSAERTLNVR